MRASTWLLGLLLGACGEQRSLDPLPLPEARDGALVLLRLSEARGTDAQAIPLPAVGAPGRLLEYPDEPATFYAFEERCGLEALGLTSGAQSLQEDPVPSLPAPRRVHSAELVDDTGAWRLIEEAPPEVDAVRLRLPLAPETHCNLVLPDYEVERYTVTIPGQSALLETTQAAAAAAGDWFIPLAFDGAPTESWGVYRIRGTTVDEILRTSKVRSMYGRGDDLYILTVQALFHHSSADSTSTIAPSLRGVSTGMLSGSPANQPFELALAWSTIDRFVWALIDDGGVRTILDRPAAPDTRAAVLWVAPGEAFAFDSGQTGTVEHWKDGVVRTETFPGPTDIRATRRLPDGRGLVGTTDGEVLMWSEQKWTLIGRFGNGTIRDLQALGEGFSVLACGPTGCFGELHRHHADTGLCAAMPSGLRRVEASLILDDGGLVAFVAGLDPSRLDLAVYTPRDRTQRCARYP